MLLTVATDDTGSIFESQTINIEIPNRSRRKKASARRIGLQKLMDFILGIISQSVQPWRLVVGRIGRIGHGELKGKTENLRTWLNGKIWVVELGNQAYNLFLSTNHLRLFPNRHPDQYFDYLIYG